MKQHHFAATLALCFIAVACLATVVQSQSQSTPFVWGQLKIGSCQQTCCCKVCSGPDSNAYPYGLLNPNNGTQVLGATCSVPTWANQGTLNNTLGQSVTGPNTLQWTSFSMFGDYAAHTAPTNCDCCRLSVDTSCQETAPTATQPDSFIVNGGQARENNRTSITFLNGVALSTYDYAELRNDSYCGYIRPKYLIRTRIGDLVPNAAQTQATWRLKMPNHGCYRVCYYQSNLTTPGWYYVGDIVVHQKPQATVTWGLNSSDVLLSGNQVTITFQGRGLLGVFADNAELRTSGNCGSGTSVTNTSFGKNGVLQVLPGADWCRPAVVPKITTTRPLRYIAVQYTDCPAANRLYVDRLTWTLTLPAAGTYKVCYNFNGGQWIQATNSMTIPAQLSATTALNALYTATGGANWKRNSGWGGGSACNYFGVRCDALGNVVSIYLGRNNLVGTLPTNFFYGVYFNTLTDLKLDMNGLTGSVPNEMGLFRNLRVLDLSQNNFTGPLPITLTHVPQLQTLYTSGNNVTGQIPYSITALSQRYSWLSDEPNDLPPAVHYECPIQPLVCSNQGSTAPGVFTCGYEGISQAECEIRGCCFNSQAPLTFGGTACFTKVDAKYSTRPPCQFGTVSCKQSN